MKKENLKTIDIPKGKKVVDVVIGSSKVFIKLTNKQNEQNNKDKIN
jgi:ubiquinone/menaquinone biosynthesis C-methylase UbiE